MFALLTLSFLTFRFAVDGRGEDDIYIYVQPHVSSMRLSTANNEACRLKKVAPSLGSACDSCTMRTGSCRMVCRLLTGRGGSGAHTVMITAIAPLGQRRSTIEVHPKCSEAPHLRTSPPHPKTDLSKKTQIPSRKTKNHRPRVYKSIFFRNKIGIPTILGQGSSLFRKPICGNVLPLS